MPLNRAGCPIASQGRGLAEPSAGRHVAAHRTLKGYAITDFVGVGARPQRAVLPLCLRKRGGTGRARCSVPSRAQFPARHTQCPGRLGTALVLPAGKHVYGKQHAPGGRHALPLPVIPSQGRGVGEKHWGACAEQGSARGREPGWAPGGCQGGVAWPMPPAPRDGKRSTRAAPEPRVPSTAAPRRGWCRSHPVRGAPARPHVPRHGPAGSARCAHLPAGQPGLGVPELGRLEAVHGAPGPPRRAAPPSAPPRPAPRHGQGRAGRGRAALRRAGWGLCRPAAVRPR